MRDHTICSRSLAYDCTELHCGPGHTVCVLQLLADSQMLDKRRASLLIGWRETAEVCFLATANILFLLIICGSVAVSPFAKVEETFNTAALHDFWFISDARTLGSLSASSSTAPECADGEKQEARETWMLVDEEGGLRAPGHSLVGVESEKRMSQTRQSKDVFSQIGKKESSLIPSASDLFYFDHKRYPGFVPRTFIGTAVISVLLLPVKRFFFSAKTSTSAPQHTPTEEPSTHYSPLDILLLNRLAIGLLTYVSFLLLQYQTGSASGRMVGCLVALLFCALFHFTFYASRALPNTFAMICCLPVIGASIKDGLERQKRFSCVLAEDVTTALADNMTTEGDARFVFLRRARKSSSAASNSFSKNAYPSIADVAGIFVSCGGLTLRMCFMAARSSGLMKGLWWLAWCAAVFRCDLLPIVVGVALDVFCKDYHDAVRTNEEMRISHSGSMSEGGSSVKSAAEPERNDVAQAQKTASISRPVKTNTTAVYRQCTDEKREALLFSDSLELFCVSFCKVLGCVGGGFAAGVMVSLLVDSYFWQNSVYTNAIYATSEHVKLGNSLVMDSLSSSAWWKKLLWPEGFAFHFNAVLGRSIEWGAQPRLWYFTNALPRYFGALIILQIWTALSFVVYVVAALLSKRRMLYRERLRIASVLEESAGEGLGSAVARDNSARSVAAVSPFRKSVVFLHTMTCLYGDVFGDGVQWAEMGTRNSVLGATERLTMAGWIVRMLFRCMYSTGCECRGVWVWVFGIVALSFLEHKEMRFVSISLAAMAVYTVLAMRGLWRSFWSRSRGGASCQFSPTSGNAYVKATNNSGRGSPHLTLTPTATSKCAASFSQTDACLENCQVADSILTTKAFYYPAGERQEKQRRVIWWMLALLSMMMWSTLAAASGLRLLASIYNYPAGHAVVALNALLREQHQQFHWMSLPSSGLDEIGVQEHNRTFMNHTTAPDGSRNESDTSTFKHPLLLLHPYIWLPWTHAEASSSARALGELEIGKANLSPMTGTSHWWNIAELFPFIGLNWKLSDPLTAGDSSSSRCLDTAASLTNGGVQKPTTSFPQTTCRSSASVCRIYADVESSMTGIVRFLHPFAFASLSDESLYVYDGLVLDEHEGEDLCPTSEKRLPPVAQGEAEQGLLSVQSVSYRASAEPDTRAWGTNASSSGMCTTRRRYILEDTLRRKGACVLERDESITVNDIDEAMRKRQEGTEGEARRGAGRGSTRFDYLITSHGNGVFGYERLFATASFQKWRLRSLKRWLKDTWQSFPALQALLRLFRRSVVDEKTTQTQEDTRTSPIWYLPIELVLKQGIFVYRRIREQRIPM